MCRIQGFNTSGVPIGTIIDFGHAALPFGFVQCNGQSLNATLNPQYLNLYNKILLTYGGTGIANFLVPNSIGRSRAMPGSYTDPVSGVIVRTAGQSIGAEKHVITAAEGPSHGHFVSYASGSNPTSNTYLDGVTGNTSRSLADRAADRAYTDRDDYRFVSSTTAANSGYSSTSGSGAAHNNMQPTLVVGNVGIAYI